MPLARRRSVSPAAVLGVRPGQELVIACQPAGRRWLLPLAVYVAILGLSSVPSERLTPLGFAAWLSYVGHAIEYGALGVTLRWAAAGRNRPVAVVVAVGAACGALDELWQSTVPGRDPSVLDLGVDVAAVAVGAVVVGRWLAGRR